MGWPVLRYLLGKNFRRRDRDHLVPPRRMDAAVCRAEMCYPLGLALIPEGENHEDASCCRHSCDGDRSPRCGEGEAGAIGAGAISAPARLSVVGATRLLARLPFGGLVPRLVIELLIFGVDGW